MCNSILSMAAVLALDSIAPEQSKYPAVCSTIARQPAWPRQAVRGRTAHHHKVTAESLAYTYGMLLHLSTGIHPVTSENLNWADRVVMVVVVVVSEAL